MAKWSALSGVVNPNKRKQWGIAPKGKGPHKAEDYELPIPSADHPRAKAFARAVLASARGALTRCKQKDVIGQVRKANTVLYGKPNPTPAEKRAGRQARATKKKTFPYTESLVHAEAYVDVPAPEGSTEFLNDAILTAARASTLFGGPCVNYGDPGFDDETSTRSWDISILWLFPAVSEVVISNSRTAEIWRVSYGVDALGNASFGTPAPAEIEIAAKGQEALRKARESGIKAPRFVRVQESGRIPRAVLTREATAAKDATADAPTTGIPVQLISAGPGNPHDRNYYTPEFIAQVLETAKFDGVQCYYNHPSKWDEENQPERSVKNIAGWFSDSTAGVHTSNELGDQPAALATFHAVVGDSMASQLLATAREYAASYPDGEFIGFSIYSYGVADGTRTIDGEEWTNVVAMAECISVDLVTHAGARGKPIFTDTQESNYMPNRASRRSSGKTGREAARANPFLDPDLQIDIRSNAEKKADTVKARRVYRENLLKNNPSLRKAAFGAIGIQEADTTTSGDGSAAPAANAIGMPKLTDDQDQALDTYLGLVDGGLLDQMLDSVLGGNDDMSDDADDSTEVDESTETTVVDGDEKDYTDEALDAMTPEDLKKIVKARAKAKAESSTVTESNRAATALALENVRLTAIVESQNRLKHTDRLIEQFKVPQAHQALFRRTLESAKSPDDMVAAAKAYAEANFTALSGGLMIGQTRESRSAAVPNFLREV
jgi:hypothetical protein